MVITTHVHWDHIGGHKFFDNIAVYEAEKNWLAVKFPIPLPVVKQNLMCKECDFPSSFNANDYQLFQGIPQKILHDGDCLDLGGRKLTVILNCTPFVRQYDILSNRWGDLLCCEENRTNGTRRNSRSWSWKP